jgi:hypothetical protein
MLTMLRSSFYVELSLSKDRLLLRKNSLGSARLSTSAQRNEPTRVTAKTEAMHIPARGTTSDPTATADYDVLDNSRFISFYDSFRYLGTQITPDLDETFEINTRIRAATKAFM